MRFLLIIIVAIFLSVTHYISYYIIKNKVVNERKWDLNICCGKTDGGEINADIVKHSDLPRFKKINNIYNLPFKDNQFDTILYSHVIEHVNNPEKGQVIKA